MLSQYLALRQYVGIELNDWAWELWAQLNNNRFLFLENFNISLSIRALTTLHAPLIDDLYFLPIVL